MANEFIARKGLKVLTGGIEVTGSGLFSTDITSSGNVKATAFYGNGANVTGVVSSSYAATSSVTPNALVTASGAGSTITFTKGDGSTFPVTITVGSSATASYVEYDNVVNKPTLVSASSQIDHNQTTNYVANQHIDHSTVSISAGSGLSGGGNITATRTLSLDTSSAHFVGGTRGTISSANTVGASGINLTYDNQTGVISGSLVNSSVTVNGQTVSLGGSTTVTANTTNALTLGDGLTGGTFNGSTAVTTTVDTGSSHFTGGVKAKLNADGVVSSSSQVSYTGLSNVPAGIVSSSTQFKTLSDPFTGSFTGSFSGDGSGLTGIATVLTVSGSSGGTDTVNLKTDTLIFTGNNGITTTVSDNKLTFTLPTGTVSSSGQVDVRNTTGIETIATTGSNSFTGVQTITNTTNSTTFADGALVVQGGVGIAKDVNISGSLTVTGLLTAVSTSIQYVTSSQLNVADNKITVQSNDIVRFGGLSVYDSGSTSATASIYWDSLNHNFIYENISGEPYNSAIFIAGPKNTGALGNEVGLTVGRVPVASGNDHIDSRPDSSSIRVDFPSRLTHVEAGLVVTGSVSSSVGFYGDGTNITNVTAASVAFTDITGKPTLVSASSQIDHNQTTNYVANQHVDHSTVSISAGSGLSGGGDITSTRTLTLNTSSAHFTNGVVSALPAGSVSSSLQFNNLTSPFTGSFTGSFTGDGSGLTGIATILAFTGSNDNVNQASSLNLKTQGLIVSASTGIDVTVSGQTLTISGENATTTSKGIASFTGSNFTVISGQVAAKPINFNGTDLNLGGTYSYGLQNITPYGATTTDQVTLAGGAIINGILFTSASATSLTDGTNQVVASVATGSYDSAMFDYVIKSGGNLRAGTVSAVWQAGTSNVEYTDVSTNDIGNTLNQSFTVDTSAANARLKFTTTGGGTWTVKTAIRML